MFDSSINMAKPESIGSLRPMRQRMPVADRWAYLDHAAIGPLPRDCQEAILLWAQQAAEDGDLHWPAWQKKIGELRSLAAELVHADSAEIAIVPNTTEGINLVAEGLPWQPGDNVVSSEGEFPTNRFPWLNLQSQGVEVRLVPRIDGMIDLAGIDRACDSRTRLVSLSWVGYDTGYRIDVGRAAEIAHAHGAYFLLDAIQGLGVFPLNVRTTNIDFFSADGHKWMLGPEGCGLFYVKRDLLQVLRPRGVGWRSVENWDDFDNIQFRLQSTAARYEGGTANTPGAIGLLASLRMLKEFGLGPDESPLADRVLETALQLESRLRAIGLSPVRPGQEHQQSGIVTFDVPGQDLSALRELLIRRKIILSCRSGRLRAAVHAYNDDEDIDRLIRALQALS